MWLNFIFVKLMGKQMALDLDISTRGNEWIEMLLICEAFAYGFSTIVVLFIWKDPGAHRVNGWIGMKNPQDEEMPGNIIMSLSPAWVSV